VKDVGTCHLLFLSFIISIALSRATVFTIYFIILIIDELKTIFNITSNEKLTSYNRLILDWRTMGKGRAEPGTPKYIANKIKSKGLQKLRWFCQMCNKQCRDENGFKCHTMSESHQRQLLLFADNAGRYLSEFSYEFSKGFLFLLKRQFGTKRVKANKVYQEYISDRTHLHMNATQWTTLTGFVKWLGKTGTSS